MKHIHNLENFLIVEVILALCLSGQNVAVAQDSFQQFQTEKSANM